MKAGKYLESKNGKYKLDFQNSGLHLSCGSTTIWKSGFSRNEVLYFDSEGLTLALLDAVRSSYSTMSVSLYYESVAIWNSSTGGHANKLVLQDDGNLVLLNDCNNGTIVTIWETKTTGACPAGLEHFFKILNQIRALKFLYI